MQKIKRLRLDGHHSSQPEPIKPAYGLKARHYKKGLLRVHGYEIEVEIVETKILGHEVYHAIQTASGQKWISSRELVSIEVAA